MLKTLLIMRHGKSDWRTALPDFERPLNRRGRRDVRAMGRWLGQRALLPDVIMSSTATRAAHTADILSDEIAGVSVRLDQDLYLAGLSVLETSISMVDATNLLVVGHNPGLEQLVRYLDPTVESRVNHTKILPTAAVFAFKVDLVRGRLSAAGGELLFHYRPKLLRRAATLMDRNL